MFFLSFFLVSVGLLFVSVQSKHRNSLFRYRSETTETNVLFRIVPKLVSVPVSVVSNRKWFRRTPYAGCRSFLFFTKLQHTEGFPNSNHTVKWHFFFFFNKNNLFSIQYKQFLSYANIKTQFTRRFLLLSFDFCCWLLSLWILISFCSEFWFLVLFGISEWIPEKLYSQN